MKKSVLMALSACVLFSGLVYAEDKPRIGYVDVRQVVMESAAGKQHKAAMEKAVKEKQGAISSEEKKLQSLKEAFDKDQLTLSEAQKRSKQRELQDRFQALQDMANDAQKELRQKDMDYTSQSVAAVKAIVGEVAKQEKVALVIEKTDMSVLYAEDGMDLTPKVLQKYNEKSARK
jgi:outer membrane protein